MASSAGNAARLGISRQSDAGTVAATTQFVMPIVSGDLAPQRQVARWDETSGSRSVQPAYVQSVSGRSSGIEVYLRPDNCVPFFEAVMGSRTTTGSGSPYTHTLAPSDADTGDLPLLSLWLAQGGAVDTAPTILNEYQDAVIDTLAINMAVGGVLSATATVKSKTVGRLADVPDGWAAPSLLNPFYFSQLAVSKTSTEDMAAVQSATISIANNTQDIQGNGSLSFYDFPAAQRVITGTMSILWESIDDFCNFHYGANTGTEPSAFVFGEALSLVATVDGTHSLTFTFVDVQYDDISITGDKTGVFMESLSFTAVPTDESNELVVAVLNPNAGTVYDAV